MVSDVTAQSILSLYSYKCTTVISNSLISTIIITHVHIKGRVSDPLLLTCNLPYNLVVVLATL